jgi:endonuclease/exonuclease/phosphatase family metal-dependent hydrolase
MGATMARLKWRHSLRMSTSLGPRRVLASFFSLALLFGAITAAHSEDDGDGAVVRIMTQNLYQGTNFTEVLSATTLPAFLGAVTLTYQNILATQPAVRAAAVAREIARERPDLVALQEVGLVRSGLVPITNPPTPVSTVDIDQLASLLTELDQLGHQYEVVAIVPNLDAQAPSSLGKSIRVTTRTVIIARAENRSGEMKLSNIQVQEFLATPAIPTPVGISIPIQRGWASVDVRLEGRDFRLVTTHLWDIQPFNLSQANEALQNAVNSTTLPVVFVGDLNAVANVPADPTFATYQALISAGLVDAWPQAHGLDPGLTCCQNPNLMNITSNYTKRVDLVLLRAGIGIRDIHLVGNNPSDRTQGLWPSDHAGLVATLRIPNNK